MGGKRSCQSWDISAEFRENYLGFRVLGFCCLFLRKRYHHRLTDFRELGMERKRNSVRVERYMVQEAPSTSERLQFSKSQGFKVWNSQVSHIMNFILASSSKAESRERWRNGNFIESSGTFNVYMRQDFSQLSHLAGFVVCLALRYLVVSRLSSCVSGRLLAI